MNKVLGFLLLAVIPLAIIGCHNTNIVYEDGFFQYKILYANPNQKHVMIIGLTASGKEQTNLIIPPTIDGIPVLKLGIDGQLVPGWDEGGFVSDQLRKVYIGPSLVRCRDVFFEDCPNLETILVNNPAVDSQIYLQQYNPQLSVQKRIYKPITNANSEVGDLSISDMITFANVVYYWNYPDSPDQGVFFIDFSNGLLGDFQPPTPVREGYVFLGWFKDPEGTDDWDFASDAVAGRTFDEQGLSPYQETALYAKWE